MAGLQRITQPTLDVLEVLLRAFDDHIHIHGWAIMKETKRAGPTVYRALDRLEDAGLIVGEWEELGPDQPGPRRRFYRLTPEGVPAAQALLAERRPGVLRPQIQLGFIPLSRRPGPVTGGGS
jgi:DNA-binding PadR family transcriptional regulator